MIVYGKKVLFEMNPLKIRKVWLIENKNNQSILHYLNEKHIRYDFMPTLKMNQMVNGNHQGVIIDVLDYDYFDLECCYASDFVLLLDHLEDPHNLGAIIRSAEAAGIRFIIIPKDRSVRVNDTVMKVSAGTLDRVKIILITNLVTAIKALQQQGFFVYASCMDGKDYKEIDYADKKVLVIGNEGKGISSLVRKHSDEIVSIPMRGCVNSLNASVAAGILMFHMVGD